MSYAILRLTLASRPGRWRHFQPVKNPPQVHYRSLWISPSTSSLALGQVARKRFCSGRDGVRSALGRRPRSFPVGFPVSIEFFVVVIAVNGDHVAGEPDPPQFWPVAAARRSPRSPPPAVLPSS